jgi:hypothetical protein
MDYDAETIHRVRDAVAGQRYELIYRMMPVDDGGESYEMQCRFAANLAMFSPRNLCTAKIVLC